MPRIQFATQTYLSKSPSVSAQRLVNLYAEREPPDAKTPVAVFGVPGLSQFAAVGFGPIRGFHVMDGVLYAVSGQYLYSVDTGANVTELGGGILGIGPVSMADNGNQVVVVNGTQGFCYSLNGSQNIAAAAIISGGKNYFVGDTLLLSGGVPNTVAELQVSSQGGSHATVTISIASPGVITWTAHGLTAGTAVMFSTTGALPTGLTAGTLYYVLSAGLTTNTFEVSATPGGTAINTSGSQSGTQSAQAGGAITGVNIENGGSYQSVPANPVSQASTSGVGSAAAFTITWQGPPQGFVQITDPAFNPANTVTFFDGYFLFDWAGTAKFFYSALYDGTTYNALNFYTAEVQPDEVLALCNQQENLLIFCAKDIETWYDSGQNNDPFARYDGATIERGCAASLSIVKEDNAVFFLGDDIVFYRLDGILPTRKSTHAIEQAWQKYTTVSDAFAFSYTFEGHKFVNIIFPTANASWVFDIASGLWHERESFKANGGTYGRWRGNCAVSFDNQILIGDAFGNQVGSLSSDQFTEYGAQIIATAVSPPIQSDRKLILLLAFELDMETGVGLTTGQGNDPQVMLDWSDDGGHTFKPLQLWRSLGLIGQYGLRVRWTRLGMFRQRVMRITISDPVRRTIIAAYAEFEKSDI